MTTETAPAEGIHNKSGVDYSKVERVSLDQYLSNQNSNQADDPNKGKEGAGADNGNAGAGAGGDDANKGAAAAAPVEAGAAELNDDQIISFLGKRGITLSKVDEITSLFTERDTLKNQVEVLSKKELEFPNDKAKALYEYASKYDGHQMAAAKTLLNAAEIDFNTASPKAIQFEAFCLKYPHLARENAQAIFADKYTKDWGDGNFENNALQKFEHDEATAEARRSIEAAVKTFKEAKSEPETEGPKPEEIEAMNLKIKESITGALKDFKGSSVELPEYKTKTGQVAPARKIEVAIKPEEAAKFQSYLEKPESFIQDMIERHKGENGLDFGAYTREMAQVFNRQQIYAEARSQGIEEGMLIILNEIKNSGGGKLPGDGAGADAPKETPAQQYQKTRQRV
jgi:hypothetical protein